MTDSLSSLKPSQNISINLTFAKGEWKGTVTGFDESRMTLYGRCTSKDDPAEVFAHLMSILEEHLEEHGEDPNVYVAVPLM